MSGHRAKRSDATSVREEIALDILRLLNPVCLQLGELLERAHRGSIDEWNDWVASSTPFTVEEARMLRATHLAYRLLPQEAVDKLPHPWQALWVIPAGRIGHGMPRSAASSKRANGAELLAARLLQRSPGELSTDVVGALAAWLHERDSDTGSRDQS